MEAVEPRVLLTGYVLGTLGAFDGANSGSAPAGVVEVNGNLYGTTKTGGSNGLGTLFEYNATTQQIVPLVNFNGSNGSQPEAGLTADTQGNLYGTTTQGGVGNFPAGTIFEYDTSTGQLSTLYSFDADASTTNVYSSSEEPNGPLTDSNGVLYGTTAAGGSGFGATFQFNTSSSAITINPFNGGNLGAVPQGALVVDDSGDAFGTTTEGGSADAGIIFADLLVRVQPLASFNSSNESNPIGGLVLGSDNSFYGVTDGDGINNNGTVFSYSLAGGITTLATFDPSTTGSNPQAGLIADANGDLFGTTQSGGSGGAGTVFELVAGSHTLTTLYSFTGGSDGGSPESTLFLDSQGDLFGTTSAGGANTDGTIFELFPSSKLAIVQQPTNTAAGSTVGSVTVDVEDANGDLVSDDNSSVTFSLASGPTGATLGGTLTVAAHNGVATFSDLSITKAGTYTLSASETGLTSATSSSFTISPLAASQLVFPALPANVTAGENLPALSVDAEDQYGNISTSDNSMVTLAVESGPPGATLGGPVNVAAQNGVATFNAVSLTKAGTYTLIATDGSLTSATSADFTVSAAAPASLVISQQPAPATANQSLSAITVNVLDQFGNAVDGSSVSVAIASGPTNKGAVLSGTLSQAISNGTASFSDLSLNRAGSYTLSFTDGSLPSVTSSSFAITYTAPTLVFVQQPTTGIAGGKLSSMIVETDDQAGNIIATGKSKIALTIASGPAGTKIRGAKGGTIKNGQLILKNISFQKTGAYTLQVTTPTGFNSGTSSAMQIAPATAKKLVFVQQPAPNPVVHGSPFGTEAELVDAYGNIATNNDSAVLLVLKAHPKDSSLSGVLSQQLVDGVADFTALSVNLAGKYSVAATDGKLKATSKSFVAT
jgi:uncharacterized repeat protein (TIGR03803 family)